MKIFHLVIGVRHHTAGKLYIRLLQRVLRQIAKRHIALALHRIIFGLRVLGIARRPHAHASRVSLHLSLQLHVVDPVWEINACHALNLFFVKKCLRHIFLFADKIQKLLLCILSADLKRNDLIRQIAAFQPFSEHDRIMAVIAEGCRGRCIRDNLRTAGRTAVIHRLALRFAFLLSHCLLGLCLLTCRCPGCRLCCPLLCGSFRLLTLHRLHRIEFFLCEQRITVFTLILLCRRVKNQFSATVWTLKTDNCHR